MKKLGLQLILELWGCNPAQLNDQKVISHVILGAAEKLNAHVLNSYFHKFAPQGVTGVVAIAESHLSIHTWPEHLYAAIDIFTCGENTYPYRSLDYIVDQLPPKQKHIQEIDRGAYTHTYE